MERYISDSIVKTFIKKTKSDFYKFHIFLYIEFKKNNNNVMLANRKGIEIIGCILQFQ